MAAAALASLLPSPSQAHAATAIAPLPLSLLIFHAAAALLLQILPLGLHRRPQYKPVPHPLLPQLPGSPPPSRLLCRRLIASAFAPALLPQSPIQVFPAAAADAASPLAVAVIQWLFRGYLTVTLWLPSGYLAVTSRLSSGYPTVISSDYPAVILLRIFANSTQSPSKAYSVNTSVTPLPSPPLIVDVVAFVAASFPPSPPPYCCHRYRPCATDPSLPPSRHCHYCF